MNYFIELLQVSLGSLDTLSGKPSEIEWKSIFTEAQRQALVGILVCGLEKLPADQRPPQPILLQWIGLAQMIESRNAKLNHACSELCEKWHNDGFEVCVLKGQANHVYYPSDMANRRNSGDIDIWTVPISHTNKPVKQTLEYMQANYKKNGLCWLHASLYYAEDIPVEVHFHPSFMNEPVRNRRFQAYFQDIKRCICDKNVDGVTIPALKVDYDIVFQMNHIYRHLVDEGVGLRQIVDYYWLLLLWNREHERSKEDVMGSVNYLGMRRFAGALMYVLKEVCGVNNELLLCPPSNKDGAFLLNEIMIAGNFGHSDPRMGDVAQGNYMTSRVSQAWRRFKRNMRFFSSYPAEVFFEPYARIWHFAWKRLGMWK